MDENTFFTKDGNLKEKIEIPDYFILFNLQKKYSLTLEKLEQSFEDWMLQLHPDLFVTAIETQKNLSLKYSAILKQAKDILSNPFQRAIYLCGLVYKTPAEKDFTQPQDFLLEMLEIRERLEQPDALIQEKKLIEQLKKEQQILTEELQSDFEKLQQEENKTELFEKITKKIGKIKYYINISEKIQSLS